MPSDLRSQIKAVAPRLKAAAAEAAQKEREARIEQQRALREQRLFAEAIQGVQPLQVSPRLERPVPAAPPAPKMFRRDEAAALVESLSDGVDAEALLDTDEALSYARDGLAPNTVRKLRRGDWVIQAQLDLHGMTREEARPALMLFLQNAVKQGLRCVRVVHGKGLGSKNREPILKDKVRRWLMQTDSVLAFVQARGPEGGAGAMVVLLKNS